uniref:uncharacterized protein LOC105349799 n=1 Tax=Fragaria vesca subsp. vesca TaxID=101020 RepID=UPI0005C886E5|nr:PREDICTED: uncharacterized protein LOC105349799 [Fragaria vesca subsp. vesca]
MHEQILKKTLNRLHMRKVHFPPNVDEPVVSPGSCTTQPTYLDSEVEILNFLSANDLLPLSDDQVLQPTTTVTPNKFESGNNNSRSVLPPVQQQSLEIKQGTNVNLLQWNQLHPTGDDVSFPPSQQGADDMSELFNPPHQL